MFSTRVERPLTGLLLPNVPRLRAFSRHGVSLKSAQSIATEGCILPAQDIIPPPGAATITFTGPLTSTPTYLTTVPVPPKSDSPEATVIGPPGDKNRCNDLDLWSLLFGGLIHPCLPLDIGIIGGITPIPVPPPDWPPTAPWSNPIPRPTPPPPGGNPDDNTSTQRSSASSSASSSSDAACPTKPADLDLPDDSDNSDWEDDGTDPDERRRRAVQIVPRSASSGVVQPAVLTYILDSRQHSPWPPLFARYPAVQCDLRCAANQCDSPPIVPQSQSASVLFCHYFERLTY